MLEKILGWISSLKTNEKLMLAGILIAVASIFTTQQSYFEIREGFEYVGVAFGTVLFLSGLGLKAMWINSQQKKQVRKNNSTDTKDADKPSITGS